MRRTGEAFPCSLPNSVDEDGVAHFGFLKTYYMVADRSPDMFFVGLEHTPMGTSRRLRALPLSDGARGFAGRQLALRCTSRIAGDGRESFVARGA